MMNIKQITILTSIILVVIFELAFGQVSGRQHWKSSDILESVVLIMTYTPDGQLRPFGTGVMIDLDSTLPNIYLVTNRHLYVGRDSLVLQINTYSSKCPMDYYVSKIKTLYTKRTNAFYPSTQDSDFVIIEIARLPDSIQYKPFPISNSVSFNDLEYGESVEFFGFPSYEEFGLFSLKFKFPIVRSGMVAFFALEDIYYKGKQKYMLPGMFLIDGVSIGGNSGGPIFIKRPKVKCDEKGEFSVTYERHLAGIITGHLPIKKKIRIDLSKAIVESGALDSIQTANDSAIVKKLLGVYEPEYEENSNLAIAISMDVILEYLAHSLKKK
ncbi:MAG: serine protease [candidate division Zixibacteria bacterium]|nr:serine protease [candidate division Zixibacteria bacterium]